jgi:hypothetical protein
MDKPIDYLGIKSDLIMQLQLVARYFVWRYWCVNGIDPWETVALTTIGTQTSEFTYDASQINILQLWGYAIEMTVDT